MRHSDELLWESNFSSKNELLKHWNIEYANPRKVNNELQSYKDDTLIFKDNELIIQTLKHLKDIRSGRINTRHKVEFKYGYIEGVMKFSRGKGLWPAFWMLGNNGNWPNCGEIDIMEWVGWNPHSCYATIHGPGYCGGNGMGNNGSKKLSTSLSDNWHKYAIEWKPDHIKWFIDDELYFEVSRDKLHQTKGNCHWVFNDNPFYIILNNACGGNFGGAFSNSENEIYNNLPNYNDFVIKYIKVYKTLDGHGQVIRY